jgi:plastocyanin
VRRHPTVVAVALLLAGVGVGCGSSSVPSSSGSAKAAVVTIKNIAYNPPTIQIAAGQTVTWKFDDGPTPHTVTADDHSFDSGMMSSGQFSHRFDAAGTYTYTCTVHPQQMKGTVVVK